MRFIDQIETYDEDELYFQFSLWDSFFFFILNASPLLSFNSLYEILNVKNFDEIEITNNFQFSLWDSNVVQKLGKNAEYFQFSLWDSKIEFIGSKPGV